MQRFYSQDSFELDMTSFETPAELIYELSTILETEQAQKKNIILKLNEIELNKSQILSLKSLIESAKSSLGTIITANIMTQEVAKELGIESEYKEFVKSESIKEEKVEEDIADYNSKFNNQELFDGVSINPIGTEILEELKRSQNEEEESLSNVSAQETKKIDSIELFGTPKYVESQIMKDIEQSVEAEGFIDVSTEMIEEEERNRYETIEIEEEFVDFKEMKQDIDEETQKKFENILAPEEDEDENSILKELDKEIEEMPTLYIKQTIRNGQSISSDGNIVIIGDVHSGAELIAVGDITVWGSLFGIAHAGLGGNERAKIRALKLNAIQLRIANCYARRPDGYNLILPEKDNTFIPEEARIVENEIIIYKMNND